MTWALDLLPLKDTGLPICPSPSSFTPFSPSFPHVLMSDRPQLFFSSNYFLRREDKALTSSLTSLCQSEIPGTETWHDASASLRNAPTPADKGRPEARRLLAHSSKLPLSRSTGKFIYPSSSSTANLESQNKHPLLEKEKNAFLAAVGRRQGLFQLNDLQIKSIETRVHLLTLFPTLPRCPHNFLP